MNPDLNPTRNAQDECCMQAVREPRYSVSQLQEKHRDIVTVHQYLLRQLGDVEVEEERLSRAIKALVALPNR